MAYLVSLLFYLCLLRDFGRFGAIPASFSLNDYVQREKSVIPFQIMFVEFPHKNLGFKLRYYATGLVAQTAAVTRHLSDVTLVLQNSQKTLNKRFITLGAWVTCDIM